MLAPRKGIEALACLLFVGRLLQLRDTWRTEEWLRNMSLRRVSESPRARGELSMCKTRREVVKERQREPDIQSLGRVCSEMPCRRGRAEHVCVCVSGGLQHRCSGAGFGAVGSGRGDAAREVSLTVLAVWRRLRGLVRDVCSRGAQTDIGVRCTVVAARWCGAEPNGPVASGMYVRRRRRPWRVRVACWSGLRVGRGSGGVLVGVTFDSCRILGEPKCGGGGAPTCLPTYVRTLAHLAFLGCDVLRRAGAEAPSCCKLPPAFIACPWAQRRSGRTGG